MKNVKYSILLDFYGEMLTEKQQALAELYYNQDLSLAEIAEHENITRQGVHDNLKRGEEYMDELERKLKLHEKHTKEKEKTSEIIKLCKKAIEMTTPNKYLTEVTNIMLKIEENLKQ